MATLDHRAGPSAMTGGDYPRLHEAAGLVSRDGQRAHLRLILSQLSLGVVAALAMDLIHPFPGWRVELATIAVLALGSVLLVQALRLRRRLMHDQDWFEGRAVAESAKTLAWRYMMRIPPFDDDVQADENLLFKLDEVVRGTPDIQSKLVARTAVGPAITLRMRATRGQEWQRRRDLYVRARLEDQIDWYDSRSRDNGKWSGRMLWLSLTSQVCAVGLAFAVIWNAEWNLVPFFTTLTASFVAWSQTKRFDDLRKTYSEARDELRRIRDSRALPAQTESDLNVAVREGEAAISREHTMWVAKSGVVDHVPEVVNGGVVQDVRRGR